MNALANLAPQTFADLERWAVRAARSDFVPREYRGKEDNIIIAVQFGAELGLHPMQALQSIAVINGKPAIYGDAALAICRASPVCEDVIEAPEIDEQGNITAFLCIAKRKGAKPVQQRFTVEDAKRARLWGKQGPWTEYPQRMLQFRARGWALRDAFPDVLKGVITREEAEDSPVIEHEAEPAKVAAASYPPPTKPDKTRQNPTNPEGNGKLDGWIERSIAQLILAPDDVTAVSWLMAGIRKWDATQLRALATHHDWQRGLQSVPQGAAIDAAISERIRELEEPDAGA